LKLVRFIENGKTCYGKLRDDTVLEVEEPGSDWCGAEFKETGRSYGLSGVKLLSPCLPSKVICLGLNYRSHAEEMKLSLPKVPILFLKPSTSIIGPGEAIIYPPQSRRVDYEAELGVVIGRKAHRVSKADALNYVFGYTCANDVTARDKQPADGQWTYAKSFDTFCPLGPAIETVIDDPESLTVRGFLNGKQVQEASTSDHHFTVADIIEFASGCMTLLPGDVIITGTPSGIGPLAVGDRFEVSIEGIGSLVNHVVGSQ
jgi:2-keto-4-pentenoate hydratase/2-oxohepta-3-ene-1,7-dioic acid hydratase in catechol pathway